MMTILLKDRMHGEYNVKYDDDVKLLGQNTRTVKENREVLLVVRKEVGLEVNAAKTKYIFKSCEQNTGQNPTVQIVEKSFENVAKLKCV
jgi:hypothetical protein